MFFDISGSGKKTVARAVSDVLSALGLSYPLSKYSTEAVAEYCDNSSHEYLKEDHVMLVDASTFPTYSFDKQEHYRQVIIKALLAKDNSSREAMLGGARDFLIILSGSSSEIDLILNGKPSHQSPGVHLFDFPSMEAKDCAGYFQTLARKDGFSLDFGVLQTIEEICLAAKELDT